MSDLLKALNGGKGELDAWLETQNEEELRTAILDFISPQETLRDKFAAKALQGMMADTQIRQSWGGFAKDAYDMADAMLEARKS